MIHMSTLIRERNDPLPLLQSYDDTLNSSTTDSTLFHSVSNLIFATGFQIGPTYNIVYGKPAIKVVCRREV